MLDFIAAPLEHSYFFARVVKQTSATIFCLLQFLHVQRCSLVSVLWIRVHRIFIRKIL